MDSSNLSSIRMGTGDLAKYPFLNEAGEYLRESGFGWEELERPDMKDVIDRAAERVEIEVSGNIYDKLDRYEIEILTFLVSLIMVKSIGMESVLRKFTLAEARRVVERWQHRHAVVEENAHDNSAIALGKILAGMEIPEFSPANN